MSFLQDNEVLIFSTSRGIREYKSKFLSSNVAVKKCYEMAEFFERAVLVGGLKKADNATCVYFLNEAIKEVKKASSVLHIPEEFFAFLKSSEYIFGFFRELKFAGVGIKSLFLKDIYSEFEEHLEILDALKNSYEKKLLEHGFYDSISEDYVINEAFISEFKNAKFFIDGIMPNYEILVLKKLCEYLNIVICLKINRFDKKLAMIFKEHFGLELKSGFSYEIELNNSKILEQKQLEISSPKITLQAFSLRSLQCAFVFDEISKMLRSGIDASKIAVILPDESFAQILQNTDKNHMLNYAMGKSVKKTKFFAILDAISKRNDELWARKLLENEKIPAEILEFFNNDLILGKEITEIFAKLLEKEANAELENIINAELFVLFELARKNTFKTSEFLELFLTNISSKSLSLAGGGEVTTMGLLESRGASFDGVIIVDFNDHLVPKRSAKELFLSSQIRAHAGLISHNDRENLQKSYYFNLISSAKMLSISYEQSEESVKSRFLKELDIKTNEEQNNEQSYANSLGTNVIKEKNPLDLSCIEHDFFAKPLSFSRLKTYLSCPALYYYRYIAKVPQKESLLVHRDYTDFGNNIHGILEKYFNQNKNKCDYNELIALFDEVKFFSNLDNLEFEILKQKLHIFAKKQNEHFSKGWYVFACEKEYKDISAFGVKLEGKIDRIDIREGGDFMVLDYKTGNLPENNLQLQFYELLTGANEAYFIDLKKSMDFYKKSEKNPPNLEQIITDIQEGLSKNNGKMDLTCNCGCKNHTGFEQILG